MNNSSVFRSSLVLLLLVIIAFLLNGCSANFRDMPEVNLSQTTETPIGDIHGSTYGGQQPIYNSRVYLMAASNSGYGATSVSKLGPASNTAMDGAGNYYTTTDSGGNFNITGDYTCTYNATNPSQSQQLYILSLSGNATYVPGTPPSGGALNPYIGLMAVLGACPSTTPSGTFAGHLSYIFVNEVSTVAAGYALAGFANGSGAIGSSGSTLAMTGMANAFANANQLYDIQGSSPSHEARLVTPGGNGTVPYRLLNTMANILAACINSNNTSPTPPAAAVACNTLYTYSANATDTAGAMLYIAQHPAANVTSLYGLAGSSVQFIDNLSTAPKDFTAGIIYTGTGLSNTVDVAIDANGDAWVTSSSGTVSHLTALGVQTSASPFTVPTANYVAIDQSGNAWVTSKGGNKVYELTGGGATVAGTPYSVSDFNAPAAIALDGNGKAYIANSAGTSPNGVNGGGDLVRISGTGSAATSSIYANTGTYILATTNNLPGVSQIAVDSSGFAWGSGDPQACLVTACGGPNLVRLSGTTFASGTAASGYFLDSGSGIGTPEGVAIDNAGNGWVAVNGTTDSLVRVTAANGLTQYAGGGINNPQGVAVDGLSNIWIANTGNNTLSEFSYTGGTAGTATALTTTSGDAVATLTTPTNLDIDESGDVWIVNSTGNSITELIGSAAPTIRPLAAAVAATKLGTRP